MTRKYTAAQKEKARRGEKRRKQKKDESWVLPSGPRRTGVEEAEVCYGTKKWSFGRVFSLGMIPEREKVKVNGRMKGTGRRRVSKGRR